MSEIKVGDYIVIKGITYHVLEVKVLKHRFKLKVMPAYPETIYIDRGN